jgi:hypothetical protein
MLRRTTLAAILAAGALLAGLPGPGYADDVGAGCAVSGGGGFLGIPYDYDITAIAYYGPVTNAPGLRAWTRFRYRLDGVLPPGDSSNVNIRLYEANTLKLAVDSPDDRHGRVWYEVRPASPTLTYVGAPPRDDDVRDHRSDDVVRFEAIFDRPRRSDPSCTAITGRV